MADHDQNRVGPHYDALVKRAGLASLLVKTIDEAAQEALAEARNSETGKAAIKDEGEAAILKRASERLADTPGLLGQKVKTYMQRHQVNPADIGLTDKDLNTIGYRAEELTAPIPADGKSAALKL